jgi:predicted nucleic acid-binding Zn ribbon protein
MPADAPRFGSRPNRRPRARGPVRPQAPAPVTSDSLMGEVLARLGGSGRAREFRVFDCYTRSVGEMLRARTQPERLFGTTLLVRVASAALAHELVLMRAEIITRMSVELGPNVVTELRTRVGITASAK